MATVDVLIPPSPLFAAHWSLFIPDVVPRDANSHRREESTTGRRIHVSGDRLNGFQLEIIRGYSLKAHRSLGSRRFAIGLTELPVDSGASAGHLPASDILKDEDEGGGHVDNGPVDDFERVC